MQAFFPSESIDLCQYRSLKDYITRHYHNDDYLVLPDTAKLSLLRGDEGDSLFECACGRCVYLSNKEATWHTVLKAGCGHPICPHTNVETHFHLLSKTALPIQAGFIAFCSQHHTLYNHSPAKVRQALLESAEDVGLKLLSDRVWIDNFRPDESLHAGNITLSSGVYEHLWLQDGTQILTDDDRLGFFEVVQSFEVSPVDLLKSLSVINTLEDLEKYLMSSEITTFSPESEVASLFRTISEEAPAATSRHAQSRHNYNKIATEYNGLELESVLLTNLLSKTSMGNIRRTLKCRGLRAGEDYDIRRLTVNPETGKAYPVGMRTTAIMRLSAKEMNIIAC